MNGSPCILPGDCSPAGQTCNPTGETCINDGSSSVGMNWWVGPPVATLCSRSGFPCTPGGDPCGRCFDTGSGVLKGQPCTTASDCNAGEVCQAQSNETCDSIHRLIVNMSSAHFGDDWAEVVHVGDCRIVPRATYAIRSTLDGAIFSSAISVSTIDRPNPNYWADCVATLNSFCDADTRTPPCDPLDPLACGGDPAACVREWPPPDGTTNFVDLQAATFAFQQNPALSIPAVQWMDVHGDTFGSAVVDPPNHVINVFDIQLITFAFQGKPYLFADPVLCP